MKIKAICWPLAKSFVLIQFGFTDINRAKQLVYKNNKNCIPNSNLLKKLVYKKYKNCIPKLVKLSKMVYKNLKNCIPKNSH